MKIKDINRFLSNLNFVLIFIGYQLVTVIFLPVNSDIEGITRSVTVPYRAVAFFISMLVILLNIKKTVRMTFPLKVLSFFWLMLVIRIFYDLNLRTDVSLNDTTQLWLYIFGICIPSIVSVMKSYQQIDLHKIFKWVYFGVVIVLLLSFLSNQSLLNEEEDVRMNANIGLQTISFGHFGVMGIVLSIYSLLKHENKLIFKILNIIVIFISAYFMFKAASRGPILALIIVLFFWIFAQGKISGIKISLLIILITLLITLINPILNFIGSVSPLLQRRLEYALEGDSSGRDMLFKDAWEIFINNPLLGEQFAFFDKFGGFMYSHNIVLDSFMGMGIVGGFCMIYILWISIRYSFFCIKHNNISFWICLILIQQIIFNMVSGAFYYNPLLNSLLVYIFLYYANLKKTNLQMKSLYFNAI